MKNNQKLIVALTIFTLVLLPIVAAYTFTVNQEVVLSGTTFNIDGTTFKFEGGDHHVKLNSVWYELDDQVYTATVSSVTMLTNVVCAYMPGSGPDAGNKCCPEGGGCGN